MGDLAYDQTPYSTIICLFNFGFSLQVTDLLGKYPDLMDEFNEFLERCENIGDCFSILLLLISFLVC